MGVWDEFSFQLQEAGKTWKHMLRAFTSHRPRASANQSPQPVRVCVFVRVCCAQCQTVSSQYQTNLSRSQAAASSPLYLSVALYLFALYLFVSFRARDTSSNILRICSLVSPAFVLLALGGLVQTE